MIPIDIYSQISPKLSVAEIDVVEGAAGPGRRLTLWLQGCLKRCPGCANAAFLPVGSARLFTVAELLAMLDHLQGVTGVSLSGGEPLLQALPLVPFLEGVRERGLSTVCYTGYTLDEVLMPEAHPALVRFIGLVDWLIEGEYRRDLPRGGPYRPSANQHLRILTDRLQWVTPQPETVFEFANGQCVITGTLPLELSSRLAVGLRSRGVQLTPSDACSRVGAPILDEGAMDNHGQQKG